MTAGVRGAWGTGVLAVSLIFTSGVSSAFKAATHERLNLHAAEVSTLQTDNYLGQQFGFSTGLSERFNGREVREWIQDGGVAEDQFMGSEFFVGALNRSRHHFHNPHPLLPWDRAGLNGQCLFFIPVTGQASVRWAQSPEGQAGEPATWADARRLFRDALTLSSKGKRDNAWARLFQTLGQQMHLIADLAVPAHTRNDIHCWPWSERFEVWAASRDGRSRISSVQPFKPDPSIFSVGVPLSDPIAKVPVARLWDTDQYTSTNPNPALTVSPLGTDPTIGLAEYTNANFFSQNTIFSPGFPFPARSSVQLKADKEIVPKTGGLRRYITKVRDGEVIDHFAVPSSLLQFLPPDLQTKKIGFDETVFGDYAAKLFPRAVGYSAALLDYFFRGKLDVDLVQPDSDNASFLQLIGANGSDDPLVDGTLTLYSDSPSGVRTSVTSVPVNGVQRGQELFSAPVTFQAPENTERFVAVYQGTLGLEKKEGTFPGGVIGKVLGGVRVEEVFSDGVRWKLRTPKGVFLLPLMVAEFEEVRWGDGDNILVARTPLGPDQPSRVVVYEVQRQAGSVELVTVDTPDGREAQLVRKSEAIFPFGMSLGTTVTFSHTIHYRQQIAIYEPRRTVFAFKPLGELTVCQFDHFELGTPAVKTVVTRDFPFQGSFPVTLDLARNGIFGTVNQPYLWDLREVGATADGRLLGLVVVSLTSPEGEAAFVPVIGLNQVTGVEEVVSQFGFSPTFPPVVGSPIWALVDLKTAEVVASTADPVLTITGEEAFEGFPGVWAHTEAIICDQTFSAWSKLPFAQTPPDIVEVNAQVQTRNGLFGLTVNGWLKNELNGLEVSGQSLFGVQLATLQDSGDFIYDCIPSEGINVCRAMGVTSTTGVLARGPAGLDEVSRSRPAPGGERLVFLAGAGAGTTTPVATVFVWDATAGRARIRHQFLDVEDVPELGPATGGTVLASTLVLSGEQLVPRASFLIPLEGTQGPTLFPGVDLRESFVLLNPSYLYSVGDLRFFRSKPPLERTALPAKLADLPDRTNLVGDYHAIRLP